MFDGHDPFLVALSVGIAILGGYTGFSLAARIRAVPGASRRLLLAGAAGFFAVGIWTMHFIGILAAPMPADAVYLVLPTVVSFLICALVVGVSLFFVSVGEPTLTRLASSAVLLGAGIASMHYVGIHGLAGGFAIVHRGGMVALSVLIAVIAAYGGLRAFLAGHEGIRLAASAAAFGIAVSGMHYTAMAGMRFMPMAGAGHHMNMTGLAVSQQWLAVIVAVLSFVIAGGFLLSLVPDSRGRVTEAVGDGAAIPAEVQAMVELDGHDDRSRSTQRLMPGPLGGLGQPRAAPVARVPVEGAEGTHLVDVGDVRSLRANAHYTLVHDGTRERMCLWSISEAEAQLDPSQFIRVHRSHIVAIPHVTFVRKEGDGAVVELDGPAPHRVPVSRARLAELKAMLGMAGRRSAGMIPAVGPVSEVQTGHKS
ncbi:LytTR family transcriptional regulator DNA-binding domain-containing protein [Bradyrhizobium sp. U87765 SZCCT0131]|uniref:MHYT domain-containing protein n=1 Tax=unclassified Bradyrhizobium TaxID=2631580 RepID=UPI001BAAF93D|nr:MULTISPECIES: MHYT domain-containing protein [unclassified Bradyrhizobium]MBR1218304.1 LytTR family transcriptional regulator DNA-binding domain-containing protein [Bradyrhizobium sp. U87765 SZCCT0131]MBR1260750.1 LytTR family transcriptional regulator DNA-binding domain-containing protein [Bradyrhizobium sp. U87765 SZCCT0134]MBR1303802.1 LytTR family transcriptional regulator DNA-binding domain-containing protein [Bradyrhizobium sp. U87765 SZCCT0110]MBR1319408.1 LytTR family transcriptional